ncbi:MAG: hypothetical protein QOI01_2034 [Mycobacterium sp.]|nr:hypothetical protein [Mycobacterium sp.]
MASARRGDMSWRARAIAIYLRGGAYVNEIQSAHGRLITDLATQLGCSVPIYGLAPSHHAADRAHPVGTNVRKHYKRTYGHR